MSKPQTSKNLTLGDETPKLMWSPMGKLVPQLPMVVTFSYELRFRHVIARWKVISQNYTFHHQTLTLSIFQLCKTKKHCLGLQNNPESTIRCVDMKTYKIIQLDQVRGHQYPLGICVGLDISPKVQNHNYKEVQKNVLN